MKIRIDILRKNNPSEDSYWQSFYYEYAASESSSGATVATVLNELNSRDSLTDINDELTSPIRWDCSCLQKKCGACAMVINGRPMLACDAELSKLVGDNAERASKNGRDKDNFNDRSSDRNLRGTIEGIIKIEPLRKFPVVNDLMVDRTTMMENLRELKVHLDRDISPDEARSNAAYEPSRCMQCGLCLEVCPNFYTGGKFFGMAGTVPASRILAELSQDELKELRKSRTDNQSGNKSENGASNIAANYKKHEYSGCGKSLSCKDICPAGIDTENLMVRSNAAAVWGRAFVK